MEDDLFRADKAEFSSCDPFDLSWVFPNGADTTEQELVVALEGIILFFDFLQALLKRSKSREPPLAEDQCRYGKERRGNDEARH